MRNRIRPLIYVSVLVTIIGAVFFANKLQPSSAQNEGFVLYQLNVHCGSSSLVTKIFTHENKEGGTVGRPLMGTKIVCAGKKCAGGPVTLANALAGLPAGVTTGLQTQVNQYQANLPAGEDWFLACLGEDKNSPKEKKCDEPAPWFGGSDSSNCRDVQSPVIEGNDLSQLVYLSFCGTNAPVFQHFVPKDYLGGVNAYKTMLANYVRKRVGSKVCCDRWREAVRTGKPCDPSMDMDCDGKRNTADFYTPRIPVGAILPDINNLFSTPEGAPVDPFPDGLNPDDKGFIPPAELCDCKWELVKGTLSCSADGKQPHVYQARWRCPSTGNERFTRKEAPATADCDSPQRKAGSAFSRLMFLSNREPISRSVTFFEFSREPKMRRVGGPISSDNCVFLPPHGTRYIVVNCLGDLGG
jgi:hypothetical protein